MQVSLRKASALEAALRDIAKGISLSKSIAVSIYETDVDAPVSAARQVLTDSIADVRSILSAAYDIRSTIAAKNAEVGVNALLNERASIEAIERITAPLVAKDRSEGTAPEHAAQAIAAQRVRNEKSDYGASESLTVNIVGDLATEIKSDAVISKKRKTAIADELLGLNVSTIISLSDETVAVLTKHNLV